MSGPLPPGFEARAECPRCYRPLRVCYCADLRTIPTRTRVALLQHPREERVPIGTAWMAHLCLPRSELHVGLDFEGAPFLSDPDRPAALLYPGDGARDVLSDPPPGPITLVVVDGTWSQSRKLLALNPSLAALPRLAFRAPTPSEYRIRKEPHPTVVSTIEALALVLGALEGDPEGMAELLRPFRAMVDRQLRFGSTPPGTREARRAASGR